MLMCSGANVPSLGLVAEMARELFFQQKRSKVAGFLSGFGSVLVGIGMGGLVSRLVVLPSEMVWPQSLMFVSLTKALHERRYFPSASRLKFFWTVAAGAFAYQFLPGFLFTTLSSLSVLCWMNPESVALSQIGSGLRGLGMGSVSLDWSLVVAFLPSPLVYPFYAAANLFFGFAIFMWVLVPWGYYSDVWGSQHMPIQSNNLYDSRGLPYNMEAIQVNGLLNEAAYQEAGPVNMSWLLFLTYFFSLASVSAAVTHVALYHGVELVNQAKGWIASMETRHKEEPTITSDVPSLWYVGILVVGFILAVVAVEITEARETVEWYTILTAVIVGFVFVVPVAWIMGMTSHMVSPNILVEMISGILWPGNGPVMVYFRVYSYFAIYTASDFCSLLKYGQYMKLPTRQVVIVKVIGTAVISAVHNLTNYLMMENVSQMCNPKHPLWGCTYYNMLRSSAYVWGTVGPARMFSPSSSYHPMAYAILLGFLLPIPFYALHQRFPNTIMAYINIPIILSSASFAPSAPSVQLITWFMVAFVFNHLIYRRFQSWWLRKNLLLSAGLDTGTFLATLIIAIILAYTGAPPMWWGNDPSGGCPKAGIPLNPTDAVKALLAKMSQQA
ncbi:hypothetical protein DSO57_1022656 [Entomophthora muscae]|uniref:Uncharacterized protein n=1 Tax=Entomophthora muscae TaxID=34485 RepID=A0ACC2T374_9FUNG|nr:hypothetical protein DSO57_1022656 [Entomophthora muscae]